MAAPASWTSSPAPQTTGPVDSSSCSAGRYDAPSRSRDINLSSLVADLETALSERLSAVKQEEARVSAGRQSLAEEKAAIEALGSSKANQSDVLQLNVGGRLFTTKRATLLKAEGSVLEGMFSGRWDNAFDLDSEGQIFLDLDPDCFAEVLHQLRLLQLSGSSEVSWSRVVAPERREVYFRAMLDFLGLAKLPAFSPTFAYFHPSISRTGRDKSFPIITGTTDCHKWSVGEAAMEVGTYMWGFKIHTLKNNHWVFLGVIASQRPGDNSYNDPSSYGWACGGADSSGRCMAFQKGVNMPSHGGWSGFQEGDDVTMQLNVDSGVLRMKVARLPQTVFHFTGLDQATPWRVHVNLFSSEDKVELLSAGQF